MSKELLIWYDQVKRSLPWRTEITPYKTWLSEIMLQQTQVVTVIEYFNRFVSAFPDVHALARADEDQVMKLWEGLGYYSRARNLMKCAKMVSYDLEGHFPNRVEELEKLPGIGPYTAGAIASIAFGQAVPAVDGNVHRVISRLHELSLPLQGKANHSLYQERVRELMTERPGDFTQAMMELGATVCTPKNPKCDVCPFSGRCLSYQNHSQHLFPVKVAKSEKKEIHMGMAVVRHGDEILLVKGDPSGLLSNLWGFPRVPLDDNIEDLIQMETYLLDTYGISAKYNGKVTGKTHIFTHLKWMPTLFFYEVDDKIFIEFPIVEWATLDGIDAFALSTAMTKQIDVIKRALSEVQDEV